MSEKLWGGGPSGPGPIELPDQFLKSNTEYAVELKALAPNGNQAAADSTFTTAKG